MTPLSNLSGRDQAALRRAVRGLKYEVTETGIVVPEMGLSVGGYFEIQVNDGPVEVVPNRVVNEGLTHMLDVELGNAAQTAAWYVALFSGNVTPAATWTAANWVAQGTEFINYTQATRVAYTPAGASVQAITNSASRAQFTADTGGGTVYGAALVSASAKSATTGILFSAARFSSQKILDAADDLNVAYSVQASSS